jgi:cytidyltransferase-like protein
MLFINYIPMPKTYVLTSWYFNPIHPWHIECFELAKALGDELWVIVNNDKQSELKRWCTSFQDEEFRMRVVSALKPVDKVVLSIDTYQLENWEVPVTNSLRKVIAMIRKEDPEAVIYFAKWWDRVAKNTPEYELLQKLWVELRDGLGAKTHHSRDYITLD